MRGLNKQILLIQAYKLLTTLMPSLIWTYNLLIMCHDALYCCANQTLPIETLL